MPSAAEDKSDSGGFVLLGSLPTDRSRTIAREAHVCGECLGTA